MAKSDNFLWMGLGAVALFLLSKKSPSSARPRATPHTGNALEAGVPTGKDGFAISDTKKGAAALPHARMVFDAGIKAGATETQAQDKAIAEFKKLTGSSNDQLAFATIRSWRANDSRVVDDEEAAEDAAVMAFDEEFARSGDVVEAQEKAILAYDAAHGADPVFLQEIKTWEIPSGR